MGYNEDPEARATLKTAFTGLSFALLFLAIVGGITFAWAYNADAGHGAAAEHAPAEAPAKH